MTFSLEAQSLPTFVEKLTAFVRKKMCASVRKRPPAFWAHAEQLIFSRRAFLQFVKVVEEACFSQTIENVTRVEHTSTSPKTHIADST